MCATDAKWCTSCINYQLGEWMEQPEERLFRQIRQHHSTRNSIESAKGASIGHVSALRGFIVPFKRSSMATHVDAVGIPGASAIRPGALEGRPGT